MLLQLQLRWLLLADEETASICASPQPRSSPRRFVDQLPLAEMPRSRRLVQKIAGPVPVQDRTYACIP